MIELLIGIAFGIWLGSKLKGIVMILSFRQVLKELGISDSKLRELAAQRGLPELDDDESNSDTKDLPEIKIKIEKHGDQLFAFRVDNDQFLGQGQDRDSLVNRIAEQYKGIRFTVPKDQGADLLRENNG